jgi:hypothetical protein
MSAVINSRKSLAQPNMIAQELVINGREWQQKLESAVINSRKSLAQPNRNVQEMAIHGRE